MADTASNTCLLFVYNADGGILNALKDAWHKAVKPESYPCSLCATTYGAVSMRPEWRDYVERLPYPAVFLHRDELHREWPEVTEPLPAIFLQHELSTPEPLVPASELPLGQSLEELKALLDQRLATVEP
jgi:hypothetical protein